MTQRTFTCPKCSGNAYETGQIRASGGGVSAFFNMDNKRFTTVACKDCGYTEMYKSEVSGLGKVLDFFGN